MAFMAEIQIDEQIYQVLINDLIPKLMIRSCNKQQLLLKR